MKVQRPDEKYFSFLPHFRYLLLPEDQTEAIVLHREPDHPLCWYLLSLNPRVLPASSIRREDCSCHRYSCVTDSLLHPCHRGNLEF